MSVTAPKYLVDAFLACKSQGDIAVVLGTSTGNLLFHLYSKRAPVYRQFSIPKASGAARAISVPPSAISRWQTRLAFLLTALYPPKKGTHGFVPRRSVVSNASRHVGRSLVLNVDLQDFFPTIHFGRVRGLFQKPPFNFNSEVAYTLAQLCTNAQSLPQGAPTSPIISNFVCRRLDTDLHRLAQKYKCTYSRYADDITFSVRPTEFSAAIVKSFSDYGTDVVIGDELSAIISKHKFQINQKKSRVQTATMRQQVTGLTVNRKVNVSHQYVRRLRAILNDWKVRGEATAEARLQKLDPARKTRRSSTPSLVDHVSGKLEFLRMVRGPGDGVYAKYAIAASKLTSSRVRPILEGNACTILPFLRESLWIVAGRDAAGDVIQQGTGFELQGIGFVTAGHVLEVNPDVTAWKAIRAVPPFDEFDILAYRRDSAFDLAVFNVVGKSHAVLRRTTDFDFKGEYVTVVGFPNWHSLADQPLRSETQVVQTKTVKGARLTSVTYSLLSGSSGGPVIDSSGHVVGVVVHSKDNPVLPNAFIDVHHLETALKAKLQKP